MQQIGPVETRFVRRFVIIASPGVK